MTFCLTAREVSEVSLQCFRQSDYVLCGESQSDFPHDGLCAVAPPIQSGDMEKRDEDEKR